MEFTEEFPAGFTVEFTAPLGPGGVVPFTAKFTAGSTVELLAEELAAFTGPFTAGELARAMEAISESWKWSAFAKWSEASHRKTSVRRGGRAVGWLRREA